MRAVAILAALFVLARVDDARACSLAPTEPFAAEGDGVAPPEPEVAVRVSRPGFACPGDPVSSCGDTAFLTVQVSPFRDEGQRMLGARVEFAAGAPPLFPNGDTSLTLFGSDEHGASLTFTWGDGNTFAQEPLDFDVTVRLDDGDLGPPAVVHVTHPGRQGTPTCVEASDAGEDTFDGGYDPLTGNGGDDVDEGVTQAGCGCDATGLTWPALAVLLRRRRITSTRVP